MVPEQPSDGDEGVQLAPDPDLRAARNEIRAVSATIREALAADDALAAQQGGLVDDGPNGVGK